MGGGFIGDGGWGDVWVVVGLRVVSVGDYVGCWWLGPGIGFIISVLCGWCCWDLPVFMWRLGSGDGGGMVGDRWLRRVEVGRSWGGGVGRT